MYKVKKTWYAIIVLLLAAAFLLGMGLAQMLATMQTKMTRPASVVEDAMVGTVLEEKLKKVSIQREMTATEDGTCEARIENFSDSGSCIRVRLVRVATGEVLYQSGIIDPDYSVNTVQLSMRLRTGWYTCRIIWEFYDPLTLTLQGKAAQSAVLVVQ